jgi:RNA recognition motif-containing protein
MKLFVGGLTTDVTDEQLMQEFSVYGRVDSAQAVLDRHSGTPRGFGFVEMPSKDEAIAAINGLNGKELNGRTLEVNEARPRPPRSPGGDHRRGGDRRRGRDRRSSGGRRRF